MSQQAGHIITDDGKRIGVVSAVGTAVLEQPDRVVRDANTGEEIAREARPNLSVQTVDVAWEDGSESTLTEHIDSWAVLGSTSEHPAYGDPNTPPPPGYMGELEEQREAVAAVVARVGEYVADVRAAGPLAEGRAAAERNVVIEDEGELKVIS